MGAVSMTAAVLVTAALAVTPVLATDVSTTTSVGAPQSTPPVPIPSVFPTRDPDPSGPDRTLTLTGTGTGYVDVAIPGTIRFYQEDLVATKTGAYAGWVAQRVSDGSVVLGAWQHNAWGAHTMQLSDAPSPPYVTVPGGTFRFYLLADGTATVKVRIGGLSANTTETAAGAATAIAGTANLGADPIVTYRSPVASTGRSLILVGTKHSSTAGALVRVNACVRKTVAEECDLTDYGTAAVNVLSSISTTHISWPGETVAGPWFAVHQVQAASALGSSSGIWLNVDMTI